MNTNEYVNKVLTIASTLVMTKEDREGLLSQTTILSTLGGLEQSVYRDRMIEKVKTDIKSTLLEINTVNNLEAIALGL